MTTRAWRRGLPAVQLVQRAVSSAYATDEERRELTRWLDDGPRGDDTAAEAATRAAVARSNEILGREVGRQDDTIHEIREFGTALVALEGDLLQGLERTSNTYLAEQTRLRRRLSVTGYGAVATGILAAVVAIFEPTSGAVIGGLAAIPIVLTLIFARLYQNVREAAERLDEKAVAVRFLRVALSSYAHTASPLILDRAVAMFVAFNGSRSVPLGPDDWNGVAAALRGIPTAEADAQPPNVPDRLPG